MIEVMIAMGMMGVLAYSMMHLNKNLTTTSKRNEGSFEARQFAMYLSNFLSNSENCEASMQSLIDGPGIDMGAASWVSEDRPLEYSFSQLGGKLELGNKTYEAGDQIGGLTLNDVKLYITNIDKTADSESATGTLRLMVTKKIGKVDYYPKLEVPSIYFDITEDGAIVDCSSSDETGRTICEELFPGATLQGNGPCGPLKDIQIENATITGGTTTDATITNSVFTNTGDRNKQRIKIDKGSLKSRSLDGDHKVITMEAGKLTLNTEAILSGGTIKDTTIENTDIKNSEVKETRVVFGNLSGKPETDKAGQLVDNFIVDGKKVRFKCVTYSDSASAASLGYTNTKTEYGSEKLAKDKYDKATSNAKCKSTHHIIGGACSVTTCQKYDLKEKLDVKNNRYTCTVTNDGTRPFEKKCYVKATGYCEEGAPGESSSSSDQKELCFFTLDFE